MLPMENLPQTNCSSALVNIASAQVWHNGHGHLSSKCFDLLKHQLKYDSHNYNNHEPCCICPLAKQRRLSFVSHNGLSKLPFDLIHCDVWGPYHILTYSGHRYFLIIFDNCTRFTWLFLLKNKSHLSVTIP